MVKRAWFKKILIPMLIAAVVVAIIIPFIYRYYNNKFAVSVSSVHNEERTDSSVKNTLVFSFGGLDLDDNIKKQISQFQKENPDIEVLIQQLPSSSDYQRTSYEAAFSSGDSSIDIINSDIVWTAEFASNGWVLPLDGYLSSEMRNDFFPSIVEGCSYKGKIYAIPKRTDIPLLFYRKDIIDTPPKTYDEMIDMIKKYKGHSGIKYGYVFQGLMYEGLVCNALEFIWNNGGEVIDGNKVTINSPQAIEGLQYLIDIVNADASSRDMLNFIEDDSRLAFQDGNALFMRNWPYCYPQFSKGSSKVTGIFGVAPLPVGPKGNRSHGTLGGWNYMINKNSRNPELAWKFIKFMTSSEMQVMDTSIGGNPPTRATIYDNENAREINPMLPLLKEQLDDAKLRPAYPLYPRISESMQQNFFSALSGKLDAKTAIENIEKDLNMYIAKGGN